MAITVGIIQGKAPDGSGNGGVTEAQLSAPIVDFISPGARDAASMRVDPPGASARQVIIKAGRYYAPNATGTMVYVVDLDTDYTLSLATNGAGNPRISSIVLKIDKATTPNIYADNVATFVEVQGTAAASPTAPSDANIQSGVGAGNVGVRLADVTLSAGYTTVTAPNIADKRTTASLNREKLPTNTIYLGHAEITANATTTSTTAAAVAGLSVTATVPSGGRKVKITISANTFLNSTTNYTIIEVWEGVVGSGTKLFSCSQNTGKEIPLSRSFIYTPSAGAKTYNVAMSVSAASTGTIVANPTSPAQILVELI